MKYMPIDLKELKEKFLLSTQGIWYSLRNNHYCEIQVDGHGQIGDMCSSIWDTNNQSIPNLTRSYNNAECAAVLHNAFLPMVEELEYAREQLKELETLKRDAARWDFVRQNANKFHISVSGKRKPKYAVHVHLTNYEYDLYSTIDEAIDAKINTK